MRALFMGGTGNISTACAKLALSKGIDLSILSRGRRSGSDISGATFIRGDINSLAQVKEQLRARIWDVVVNFIAYTPVEIERDIQLFTDRCRQYIFISSASAYQKPPSHAVINESTPLANPYWD